MIYSKNLWPGYKYYKLNRNSFTGFTGSPVREVLRVCGGIRCQSRAHPGDLGVKQPSESPGLNQRQKKRCVKGTGLSRRVHEHRGIAAFTPNLRTRSRPDTKSIFQRVLFDNAQGRAEGCHLQKIGFHVTEQKTVDKTLHLALRVMKFTLSVALIRL